MNGCKSFCFLQILVFLLIGNELSARINGNDSIRQVITNLPDSSRLPYINDLANKNSRRECRLFYAQLLKEEAKKQHNDEYLANAFFLLAKHYYSFDYDSMRYWIDQAEPLLLNQKRHEDLCRMKGWDIYALGLEEKREETIKAVEDLKLLSDRISYPEGHEMAEQGLANFYFKVGMAEEGEELYLTVLRRMEQRDAPLIKKYNIIRHLMNSVPSESKRSEYLGLAEKLLQQCYDAGIDSLDNDNSVHDLEYVLYRNYAHLYKATEEWDKLWHNLTKAQELADKYNMLRAEPELASLYSFYYYHKDDYKRSLEYTEIWENVSRRRNIYKSLYDALYLKTYILNNLNRPKEAYDISLEMLALKDSINKQDFHKVLAEIQTKHGVERLEMETGQMEERMKQTRLQLWIVLGGFILLLFIIMALVYMMRVIHKNRKELRLAKERAEEADRLKSVFLANMNHEIRTPLNAIVGFSQVLVDEENVEARREYSEIIQNNNELLQRLINDILDISKIESNSMSLIYSEQDACSMMKEIYNVVKLRVHKETKLILEPCEALLFDTDRNRLVQVLTNLLTNAIKHTPRGHIRFGYKLKGEYVEFYVQDTGEGINKDQLDTIFDRFVQLENGNRGVGLGLAISKGLITKMGGSIWATSEEGKGSVFYVSVPIRKPGAE